MFPTWQTKLQPVCQGCELELELELEKTRLFFRTRKDYITELELELGLAKIG